MFVLIDALQRIESAATDALAVINDGSLSNAEARQVLAICKPAIAVLSAARTSAAQVIAGSERHGDGGAQVLADAAGLTRHEAHSQIKTAEVLQGAPVVRDAVVSGRVSAPNARRLAETISKTSAETVESDPDLLQRAESSRPEQFTREARRWTADHQADGGEADYRQMRARRRVWFSDGDDGMMRLHGEFDPVTGQRIANRLNHTARRLHCADQLNVPKNQRRTLPQCLADALDDITAGAASPNGSASGTSAADSDTSASGATAANPNSTAPGSSAADIDGPASRANAPHADICVVAHVDDETGRLIGELPDGARLPRSVLDGLTCNSVITGVVFDRCGKAIWQTSASRRANETQRRILKAKWGGCFHCGANFAICQPHHIEPVSHGGQTHVGNLVPACWGCHQLIHRDGWQIHKSPDGNHTLHPPQRINYGPAHAPEQPPLVVADPPIFTTPIEPEARAQRETAQVGAAAPGREAARPGSATGTGPAAQARAVLRAVRDSRAARDGPTLRRTARSRRETAALLAMDPTDGK